MSRYVMRSISCPFPELILPSFPRTSISDDKTRTDLAGCGLANI